MEFKEVKAVEFGEEKSVQQIEQELLDKHEKEQGIVDETKEEPIKIVVDEQPNLEKQIEENDVLSFIKNRYNKEINTVEELFEARKETEELPEDVSLFLKFKKETGRGIDDFVKLNRDFDSEDPNKLLFDYYKVNNPELDDEEVAFELETRFKYDEDLDDERDIKKKRIAHKQELTKAKNYFNQLKEQYKTPLESRGVVVPDEEKEQYNAFKQYAQSAKDVEREQAERAKYFAQKTEELFSNDFKGFGFKVGDSEFVYKPAEAEVIKRDQSNLTEFIKTFLDDKGYIKDPAAYHRAIAVARNPEAFAKFFYDQGASRTVDSIARESKNIDMGVKSMPESLTKGGMKITALDNNHGSRLVIKSKR